MCKEIRCRVGFLAPVFTANGGSYATSVMVAAQTPTLKFNQTNRHLAIIADVPTRLSKARPLNQNE